MNTIRADSKRGRGKKKIGFAAMSKEKRIAAASKGGRASANGKRSSQR
jgi:hypothetical protein